MEPTFDAPVPVARSYPRPMPHIDSCQRVELQPDDRGDRRVECVEWAPVVGVENSPVLQVGDAAFDDGAGLVDGGVEYLLPVEKIDAVGLLDGCDYAAAHVAFVAGPVAGVSPGQGGGSGQTKPGGGGPRDWVRKPRELRGEGAPDLDLQAGCFGPSRVQARLGGP